MNDDIRRPVLARHARYRWDDIRRQHQLVFPEGILVLNETGAAIVRLCNGRPMSELIAALQDQFPDCGPLAPRAEIDSRSESATLADEVSEFLARLARKGLLRDAADDA